jgi:DNA-binding transcriptional regulator YiaG
MWDHVTTTIKGVQTMTAKTGRARDHRLVKGSPLDYATIEQIRALYAAGHTRQAIATKLGLSWSTVRKYTSGTDDLEDRRVQKKAEMIDLAWEIILDGLQLSRDQIRRLRDQGEQLSAGDIQRILTGIGITFDKQALAQGDPTQIAHGVVAWQDIACGQDRDQDPGVDPTSDLAPLDE